MKYENARALAIALRRQEVARAGLVRLHGGAGNVPAPPTPVQEAMEKLATTYVRAQHAIDRISDER